MWWDAAGGATACGWWFNTTHSALVSGKRGQAVFSRSFRWKEDTEIQLVFALTQRELWRVVIDISEGDFDLSRPRQSSHVTTHVFGLDDNIVFLASLTVHVWQGGTDYTWMERQFSIRLNLCLYELYMSNAMEKSLMLQGKTWLTFTLTNKNSFWPCTKSFSSFSNPANLFISPHVKLQCLGVEAFYCHIMPSLYTQCVFVRVCVRHHGKLIISKPIRNVSYGFEPVKYPTLVWLARFTLPKSLSLSMP